MKMLNLFYILIIVVASPGVIYAQSENDTISASFLHEFQLRTEEWRLAYNSKDAQNLVPFYTVDADYISSQVAGLEAKGRVKLIANFQKGMDMGGFMDSIEILKLNVSRDMAALSCKYQATNDGLTVVGRNLILMKKINGIWLITLHMTVV